MFFLLYLLVGAFFASLYIRYELGIRTVPDFLEYSPKTNGERIVFSVCLFLWPLLITFLVAYFLVALFIWLLSKVG